MTSDRAPSSDERDGLEPPETAGEHDALLATERRRAAAERGRFAAEVDRLAALLAARTEQLARSRAQTQRLLARPGMRAHLRLLGIASRLRAGGRRTGARQPGARQAGTGPGTGHEGPAPDPDVRRAVAERIRSEEGPPDGSHPPYVELIADGRPLGPALDGSAATRPDARWLLIRDPDVEGADPDWLTRLADAADRAGAAAASPRTIHIVNGQPRSVAAGIAFEPGPGLPRPILTDADGDPFGEVARATRVVAVPTPSAILVRLDALAEVAGEALPFDTTDLATLAIELGLRLWGRGRRIVHVGSAVVWSRASGEPSPTRVAIAGIHDRWGPRLHRQVWDDARRGGGMWASRRLTVAVQPGPDGAADLAKGLRDAGFDVTERALDQASAPPADIVIASDVQAPVERVDRSVLRVGLLRSADRPAWREDLDIDLAETASAGEVATAIERWIDARKVAIHIGPADWSTARTWGDTAFGRAVERAVRARGLGTNVVVHAERDDDAAKRADIALHVVGTRRPPLRSGQLNSLWIISHPDAVRAEDVRRYDAVFVASDAFAAALRAEVGPDALLVPLHQATDPDRFHPEPGGPAHDLLFIGNSRNRRRPVLDALADTTHDLAVYGTNWKPGLLDQRFVRASWIANEDVGRFYAAAAIVLNDHWPDMRDEGFISNRVYDIAASGGFVLTDDVVGLAAEFDGGVAAWRDGAELRSLVERFLADPAARRAMSERARSATLARHTFGHRADTLLATWSPLLKMRPARIEPD